jgi:hypothetical protein
VELAMGGQPIFPHSILVYMEHPYRERKLTVQTDFTAHG